jgi:hypothetical protein
MPARAVIAAAIGSFLLLAAGCSSQRAELPRDELYRRLDQAGTANLTLLASMRRKMVLTLEADLAAGRRPSIDLLVLSGGADWGAYGTGFLRAWASLPAGDPRAMPQFDMVNGISTGALIAPYAYLGLFDRIDDLYRGSSVDWAREHTVYSMLSGTALFDISVLEDRMQQEMEQALAPGLREHADSLRSLVVATADLDLGILRLWDLQAAATDPQHLYQVQRAAIAIPAAFEPVVIDGTLQADAGVLMQLMAIGQVQQLIDALEAWNRAHPANPARLRYWVVVNNRTYEPPATVQPTWHGSLFRTTQMMTKAGVIAPLANLWLRTQVLQARGIDAEFHWTSVPPDFPIDDTLSPFDPRTTCALSDLGRQVALSATPWRVESPLYIEYQVNPGMTSTPP